MISFDSAQISNIAVLGPFLYWIDREKLTIERVNKTSGIVVEGSSVMNQTPHLVDIIAIYIPTPEVMHFKTIIITIFKFIYIFENQ